MKIDKKFIDIDGIKTAYIKREGGEKTAVILHGWGAYIESIMPIFNAIPENYTVYAYDGPGFGDSERELIDEIFKKVELEEWK